MILKHSISMKPAHMTLLGVLVFVATLSPLSGGEQPKARSQPIKLTGIFDPFERQDTNVTHAVVMKPIPKCGECHARAVLSQDGPSPRLELFVAHGRTTNSWVIAGRPKDRQIVFEKPKFRLAYAEGRLRGTYEGRMRARIELKPGE
ncbi:MAG: hypothetical protein N2689_17495 [Verrucomicrobiae bacterium]|nr:hypothetical protein [Verrucomicrobiae bacterium]